MMIKHNKLKVITLHAYDAQGEVVDLLTTETNMNAELVYLDFEHSAMSKYKAIRFTMEVAYCFMFIFFLSSAFARHAEASNDYIGGLSETAGHIVYLRDHWVNSDSVLNGALSMETKSSPFESSQPPIGFIFQWPWLPSTGTILVRQARESLRVYMAAAEEERRAEVELMDWRSAHDGLGMMFIGAALFLFTIVYGKWRDLRRKPFDLNDTI